MVARSLHVESIDALVRRDLHPDAIEFCIPGSRRWEPAIRGAGSPGDDGFGDLPRRSCMRLAAKGPMELRQAPAWPVSAGALLHCGKFDGGLHQRAGHPVL